MNTPADIENILTQSSFFGHLPVRDRRAIIKKARLKHFAGGTRERLDRQVIFPLQVRGVIHGQVMQRGMFIGVMPFTCYASQIELFFTGPSRLLVWNTEDLAAILLQNPVNIPPYLLAVNEHGYPVTDYGISVGNQNSRMFGFVLPQDTPFPMLQQYSRHLHSQNDNRRILALHIYEHEAEHQQIGDSPENRAGNIMQTDGSFDLGAVCSSNECGFETYTTLADIAPALDVWQLLIRYLYQQFNYILISLPENTDEELMYEILAYCHRIFLFPPNRQREWTNMEFLRRRGLMSTGVRFFSDGTRGDWSGLGSDEWEHRLPHYPPDGYALSLGSSTSGALAFYGGITGLVKEMGQPSMVVAAGWSVIAAAHYCLFGKLEDLDERVLQTFPEKLKQVFEIVFPKTGILQYQSLRQYLKRFFDGFRLEDMKVPLVFRVTDLDSGELCFLDHGPLIDAILQAVRMPGILSFPDSDSYLRFSGDYFHSEEKVKMYLTRQHFLRSVHFLESWEESGDQISVGRNFFDLLLAPYQKKKLPEANFFPLSHRRVEVSFPGNRDWQKKENWEQYFERGQEIVRSNIEQGIIPAQWKAD